MYKTLISAADVMRSSNTVILDCRFRLDNPTYGSNAYREGHLPGAQYVHLEQHLCGPKNGQNGRHPLPDPVALAAFFGQIGIRTDTQVVVYDDDIGIYAARAWWLLRWLGHSATAVLDGGLAAWTAQQGKLTSITATPSSVAFTQQPPLTSTVEADVILANLAHPSFIVVDARSPERFLGEDATLDPIAGHIPAAVNRYFRDNTTQQGYFKPVDMLRQEWDEVLGPHTSSNVVHQCGSGITACHNLLALEHIGKTGGRLYPGSWSEWCSRPDYPITRASN